MVSLRPARPGDAAAIRAILTAAFPTAAEAMLVDALRADDDMVLEWVAQSEGEVVGAVQYSPLELRRDEGPNGRAVALAPIAVQPARQGQGLGG